MESPCTALIEQIEKLRPQGSQPVQPDRGQHEGVAEPSGWGDLGCLCQQQEMVPLSHPPALATSQSPFEGMEGAGERRTRKAASAESKGEKEAERGTRS